MVTSSSGLIPPPLVDAIRAEALALGREQRTWTFHVEFRVEKGRPIEARLRGYESLHSVQLST